MAVVCAASGTRSWALPAGYRYQGSFGNLSTYGFFWSTSKNDGPTTWRRYFGYACAAVDRMYFHKAIGYAIR